MRFLIISLLLVLAGCASEPPVDTIPSPEISVPDSSFQIRLTDVSGASARDVDGSVKGAGRIVGGEGAAEERVQGTASGCVLTVLGKPHPRIKATLRTVGRCTANVKYGDENVPEGDPPPPD